jgi:2-polyprenyl-3-methyl-5-hydroxy-6-metoxy-1,4-benzoquinol methylase
MAAENLAIGDYDAYADEYAVSVAWRERAEAGGDAYGILPDLLELLGDVGGCRVLDAGCGDGYLARVLAARGAQVTGIDLAPRLIEMARSKNPGGDIDYRVGDLSQPLPDDAGRFGVVTSYLVLNDVRDVTCWLPWSGPARRTVFFRWWRVSPSCRSPARRASLALS